MRIYISLIRACLFCVLCSSMYCFSSEEKLDTNLHTPTIPILYLTWQRDPTSTITIQWITPNEESSQATLVQYAKDKEEFLLERTGKTTPFPENHPLLIHSVELDNLEPNCTYQFKIKPYAEIYRFKTMPTDLSEPIAFITGGDTCHKGVHLFEQTNKQVALHSPRFVVLGGDLAYAANDVKDKEDFHRWYKWFECWTQTMKTPDGLIIPLLVTIGNHEVKGRFNQTPDKAPYFYSLFPMPGPQGYNIVNFSSYLSLILLDSGHTHDIKGEQSEWLQEVLTTIYGKTTHRFAFYHVPAYPSVRPYRQPKSTAIRRYWVPLFEKYGIHFAFENHDHTYKRTFPLVNESIDFVDGVIYIGDGAWGVKPRSPKRAGRTTYLAKSKGVQNFIKVEITDDTRTIWAIDPKGKVIDHFVQPVKRPLPNFVH